MRSEIIVATSTAVETPVPIVPKFNVSGLRYPAHSVPAQRRSAFAKRMFILALSVSCLALTSHFAAAANITAPVVNQDIQVGDTITINGTVGEAWRITNSGTYTALGNNTITKTTTNASDTAGAVGVAGTGRTAVLNGTTVNRSGPQGATIALTQGGTAILNHVTLISSAPENLVINGAGSRAQISHDSIITNNGTSGGVGLHVVFGANTLFTSANIADSLPGQINAGSGGKAIRAAVAGVIDIRDFTLTTGSAVGDRIVNVSGSGDWIVLAVDDANSIATLSGSSFLDGGVYRIGAGGTLNLRDDTTVSSDTEIRMAGAGGTLDLTGLSGSQARSMLLTGSTGTVVLGVSGMEIVNPNDASFGGQIQGTGKVKKSGAGSYILSGANSYTGGTEIVDGELNIANDANLGDLAGHVTIDGGILFLSDNISSARAISAGADNATIRVDAAKIASVSGVIDGAGQLTKSGDGTLILNGVNTYSGGTKLAGGTLSVSADQNLGDASSGLAIDGGALALTQSFDSTRDVIIGAGGAVIDTATASTNVFTGLISGTGGLTKHGAGTMVLGEDASYSGGTLISAGTLQIGNGGDRGNILGDISNNGILAFDRSDNYEFSGTISGSGNVRHIGGGVTTLSGINSYSGGTSVTGGGVLSVSQDLNLGAVSGGVTLDNSTLLLTSGFSTGRAITIGPNGGTVQTMSGQTNTLLGNMSGSGALTKSGDGTLVLSGTNTHTGGTFVMGGVLSVASDASLGGAFGSVTLDSGTLLLSSNFDTARTFYVNAGGGTIQTLLGNTNVVSGVISGTGRLTKAGDGTLVLTGTNLYQGGTALNGGVLAVGADLNLGLPTGALEFDGGTLLLTNSFSNNRSVSLNAGGGSIETVLGQSNTFSGLISGIGGLTKAGAGTLVLSGSNSYTGGTRLNGGVLSVSADANLGDASSELSLDGGTLLMSSSFDNDRSVTLESGGGTLHNSSGITNSFNGVISGSGPLIKSGDGKIILSGTNTYAGGTDIIGGVLSVSADGNLGAVTGGLTIDNATLQLTNSFDTGRTVTVTGTATVESETGSLNTLLSAVGGNGKLSKTGGGTLILGNNNSYTGGTEILGGTLSVSQDNGLGAAGTGIRIDNGTLLLTGNTVSSRAITIGAAGGTIENGSGITNEIAGTISGSGQLVKAGDGTLILSADNSYTGGTNIADGILQVGAGGITGSLGSTGVVSNEGTLAFNRLDDVIIANTVIGSGGLQQNGTGKLTLTADSTFTGDTVVNSGILELGAGGNSGMVNGDIDVKNGATLAFNHSNNINFDNSITGTGLLQQNGNGYLVLTADNSAFAGDTNVNAGALLVNGQLGGTVSVASGASLGGFGSIGGNTTLSNGATLIGSADRTLTFNGNLVLGAASNVSVTYGSSISHPFFDVKGDLALGGTINVVDFGGNGPGIYRVFSYDGSLSGAITIGDLPADITDPSSVTVQIAANQVNLMNAFGASLNFWDGGNPVNHGNGAPSGGDGVWDTSSANWTEAPSYLVDGTWSNAEFAIFDGAPGTVTVDSSGGGIFTSGMQFVIGGYRIIGNDLALVSPPANPTDQPVIRVGNGDPTDPDKVAVIAAVLTGADGLHKAGDGTLVLASDNTFTGGTLISAGVLQLGEGGASGSVLGTISLGSGTEEGIISINRNNSFTLGNVISGNGSIVIEGSGETTLAGHNSYLGGTFIQNGTVIVSEDDNLGDASSRVEISNNSILRFVDSIDTAHAYRLNTGGGTIEVFGTNTTKILQSVTGAGQLTKNGTGTLVLVADNAYTGGTIIDGGTLKIGDGGDSGSIIGNIVTNSALVIDRNDAFTVSNAISGVGNVEQMGSGSTTLTGNNSYSGATIVSNGSLKVSTDNNLGTSSLVLNGGIFENTAALTTNRVVGISPSGGTFRTDANLTLQGVFDASSALTWHKTGVADLVFDTNATGDVGPGGNVDAGRVIIKGVLDGDFTVNDGGTLIVSGEQNGSVIVADGGTLMGTGAIDKSVVVADAGVLQGMAGQTLTIGQDLTLNASSVTNVTLGMPSVSALYDVRGNLTLDGTLNITDAGGFGPGLYRLFDYQGSLTDNMMTIGTTPAGTDPARMWIDADTTAKNVNLLSASGVKLNVWDEGDGTWNLVSDHSNDVWTDNGDHVKGPFDQGSFALFNGPGGQVTVDNGVGAVTAGGLQFATDGYRLTGDSLILDGVSQPIIRVGNGTISGTAISATIDAEIVTTQGINKTDYGTLILTGENHYTGGTTVTGGVLQIGATNGTSGSIEGNVTLAGDPYGHGTLAFVRADQTSFGGEISGIGNVVQRGTGTTVFNADNSYSGGLTVESGIARAGVSGHSFGTGILRIKAGGIADLDGLDTAIGGLDAFDTTGQANDGNINLGSAKLTINQNFDSRFNGAIFGTGGIVKQGSGTLAVFGANSYSGLTQVDGGTLRQGIQGALSAASSYSIASGGILDLGGFDTSIAAMNNAGMVIVGSDTAGHSLSIAGNYVGNGGTVTLNTILGDDTSVSDRLNIAGNSSGTSNLRVLNRGGLGAATVNGIEVVHVEGASDGNFALLGDYRTKDGKSAIWAGAYAYTLQRGAGTGASDANWYLISRYGDQDPTNPVDPDGPTGPRYSAAVPVYQGYVNNMQTLNKLPSLRERVGERYWSDKNGDGQNTGAAVDSHGIWARIEGAHNRLRPTTPTNMHQDVNTFLMQAGLDGQFYEDERGKLVGSVLGQYGTARGKIGSFFGDGTIDTTVWSLGATMTWYGANGFYVDTQGQFNWFNNSLFSDEMNANLASGTKPTGLALGVETGQRFNVTQQWAVTPQAQLTWSSLHSANFTDVMNDQIGITNGDSLVGRLGIAVNYDREWNDDAGLRKKTSLYAIANLYQELLGDDRISMSGVDISSSAEKTWLGLGLGGTYALADDKYSLYGNATINAAADRPEDNYQLKFGTGFNMKW